MHAELEPDDRVVLSMTMAEVTVLHELIASAEFAEDLDEIALPKTVDRKVMSDVQQALAPLIATLGTKDYGRAVEWAYESLESGPYADGA